MTPVREAVTAALKQGDTLRTPTEAKPFKIGRVNAVGLELLLGKQETPTLFPWSVLEGVVDFLAAHGEVRIGGAYDVAQLLARSTRTSSSTSTEPPQAGSPWSSNAPA